MGRMYVASFSGVAVSAQVDFFELNVPSDAVVIVHRAAITDDTGETSEQAAVSWIVGHATSGSGGSTPTPVPLNTGDAAFGGTVETNNTTIASTGTTTVLGRQGFNYVGSGYQYTPTPEERLVLSPSARLVLRLASAPGASRTLSGEIVFEEIGG